MSKSPPDFPQICSLILIENFIVARNWVWNFKCSLVLYDAHYTDFSNGRELLPGSSGFSGIDNMCSAFSGEKLSLANFSIHISSFKFNFPLKHKIVLQFILIAHWYWIRISIFATFTFYCYDGNHMCNLSLTITLRKCNMGGNTWNSLNNRKV